VINWETLIDTMAEFDFEAPNDSQVGQFQNVLKGILIALSDSPMQRAFLRRIQTWCSYW
jgi:hypothetical protein